MKFYIQPRLVISQLLSQSSVESGTEVELGILEKPAEDISLVG